MKESLDNIIGLIKSRTPLYRENKSRLEGILYKGD